jgi:N-acetylglucosaminyl-diphospho-decaprenol L-rhamnosyltransferase
MTCPLPEPGAAHDALGVVVVHYNSLDLTLQCIGSLLTHSIAHPSNIVVVDNASPDGSGEHLEAALPLEVRLVRSKRNGGFGAGINLGMLELSTELALVLNPDTYFRQNDTQCIVDLFKQHPKLGVAGLKLINPDGSLQYSARRFYSLPDILARRTLLGRWGPMKARIDSHLLKRKWGAEPFEADWVMGTGFVLRRSAFLHVGRMDERYFLYFEEVDLCARMWLNNWTVMALPSVELVHEHQRDSAQSMWAPSAKIHLRSMRLFFSKFGVPWVTRPSRKSMARWPTQHSSGLPAHQPER